MFIALFNFLSASMRNFLEKDLQCLMHMFIAKEFVHNFLLANLMCTLNFEDVD
jgi:hypothetical protein